MLNDYQMAILTADRHATYRVEAEQLRLAKQVDDGPLHPIYVWLGRQLIAWGQRVADRQATVTLPLTPEVVTRLSR